MGGGNLSYHRHHLLPRTQNKGPESSSAQEDNFSEHLCDLGKRILFSPSHVSFVMNQTEQTGPIWFEEFDSRQ